LPYPALFAHKEEVVQLDSPSMTVHDVALYLKVDEKTVYRLVQRAELPGFKVAGTWRFKQTDIDAWIEQRKSQSTEKKKDANESA
jgi:excisionase family DNA binding protein